MDGATCAARSRSTMSMTRILRSFPASRMTSFRSFRCFQLQARSKLNSGGRTRSWHASFPAQRFQVSGWQPISSCVQRQTETAAPEASLLAALAEILVQGCLQHISLHSRLSKDLLHCKVQCSGRAFWKGVLPSWLTFAEVQQLWDRAHHPIPLPGPTQLHQRSL